MRPAPAVSASTRHASRVQPWRVAVVLVCLGLTFVLDARTGAAPFQHLYYLPIVIAGLGMPRYAGPATGLAAIVLYHIANPVLLASRYRESDVIQVALFLAIGLVTAKLADDRRRLRLLSITDDLTGLLNLRGFEIRLTAALHAARATHTPVSLLVLDVDRLKSINDTHGHRAGADAVQTVGQLIGAHLPPGAFACRFGGDEFVVGLPRHDRDAAHHVAQTFRRSVETAAPSLAGLEFPTGTLSISVGVACRERFEDGRPGSLDEGEALFRAADHALYESKAGGRNRISVA